MDRKTLSLIWVAALAGATFAPLSGAATPATLAGSCLSAQLEAFERTGLLRTLAEPTLTAISGETADFLAGGEYPVPTADKNNTITVSYKKFGVSVAFTPLVMAESRISLKISSEVSELTNEGAITANTFAIKALKVRRANTTVELPSGGSMMIAGLISDATRQSAEGLPGLVNRLDSDGAGTCRDADATAGQALAPGAGGTY